MKVILIAILSFLVVPFFSIASVYQQDDIETFVGVYDGKEDYGYNFIGIDEDDDEYTMTFHEVEKAVLKSFDLHSEALIGAKFEVSFSVTLETVKDDDDFEDEIEKFTIVHLKKIK